MKRFKTLLMAFVMLASVLTVPVSIYAEEETTLTKLQWLDRMGVIDEADARFAESNLTQQCSLYDLNEIINIYNGTPNASNAATNKNTKMTQGNIVKKFNQLLGISGNYISYAQVAGLISDEDGFTNDSEPATYGHLLALTLNAVCFDTDSSENTYNFPVFKLLLESGNVKISEKELDDYATADMLKFYHYGEKKLPATAVTGIDGRTYYYVDFYGEMLYRPYFSQPQWTQDGTSFICMTAANKNWTDKNTEYTPRDMHMYMYNVETQTIKYLDDCSNYVCATIANDYIYYIKVIDWTYIHWEEMWRVHTSGTKEPEWLLTFPRNMAAGMPHVTNDGMYASFEVRNNNTTETWYDQSDYNDRYNHMSRLFPDQPEGSKALVRVRIGGEKEYEEYPLDRTNYNRFRYSKGTTGYNVEKYGANFYVDDYNYTSFDYSNTVNHVQINPEYPDLFFFAHEGDGGDLTEAEGGPTFNYRNILSRSNIMDISTGEITRLPQGQQPMNWYGSMYHEMDYSMLQFTHESWSQDGEYLYITCLGGAYNGNTMPNGGVIRVNKDGTHRKFYHADESLDYNTTNHSTPTGDNRYAVADNTCVSILSLETNQLFPICDLTAKKTSLTGEVVKAVNLGHPYHAHVVAAHDKHIANWGMVLEDEGPLGIAWYDFSSIDRTDLASGGRYSVSDSVDNVRYSEPRANYPAMPCDTDVVTKDGVSALYAEAGEKVYLDINDSIIDELNGSVNITFDYFDNSTQPLILTYTKGVETDNDWCEYDNKTLTINRTGTNTWKTTTVNIPSGNFETIGRYDTDFNIAGKSSDCYIANVTVENASALNTGDIQLGTIADNGSGYTIKGEVKKNNNTKNAATIIATAKDADGKVTNTLKNVTYGTDSSAKFELDLAAQSGSEVKFFVFNNLNNLSPIGLKLVVTDMSLSAQSMANGVKLSWDAVEGASSYTIFKDGKKLATTTSTNYNDKYFSTAEQLAADYMDEHTTPHTYIIESNNGYVSTSVESCANTSLIHYVDYGVALDEDPNATGYTGTYKDNLEKTVASFGDTANEEYTIMLCAQRKSVSQQSVFAVKDASGNWKTLPYADGANEEFTVYYGHTSHPLIAEPAINFSHTASKFPTTTYSTSNNYTYTLWNTYVFDINACFNGTSPNFKLLQNSDGSYPVVRKVGFVKSEYYLK